MSDEEQDSLLQYNMFAYCVNDPINNADYDGYAAANIIGGVVGGVAGAAAGYLLAKKLGLTGWKRVALIAGMTAGGALLGAVLGPYVARTVKSIGSVIKAGVKSTARKVVKYRKFTENANKVHHFFGKSQHDFGKLLRRFGGNEHKGTVLLCS